MNIIFLDVDGVLNSLTHAKELYLKNKRPYSGYDFPFDARCLNNLKYLVEETNSYIVITSSWRIHREGREILLFELKKYNLDTRVIGYTDVLHQRRGEEVKAYLNKLDCDVNYIILDDDNDFDGLEEYLIKTSFQNGLTKKDVELGIKKLLKKM